MMFIAIHHAENQVFVPNHFRPSSMNIDVNIVAAVIRAGAIGLIFSANPRLNCE